MVCHWYYFGVGIEGMSEHFRARRMRRFLAECAVTAETRVLDVGGNPPIWQSLAVGSRPQVTYLNMPRAAEDDDDRGRLVFGDGLQLPFRDGEFDVAFSNSVIEHVGSAENQRQFAAEVRRVAKVYWVQTPNYWFPIEQHLLTPIVHWLPMSLRAAVVRRATVWGVVTKANEVQRRFYVDHFLSEIRLLSAGELAELFPGCRLIAERFLGWKKSLIATGGSGRSGRS